MFSDSYSVIQSIVNSNCSSYVATIIHVEGSAYRKEGTMMFFTEDGEETGLLSGGCVEQDILARVESNTVNSCHLVYDLRSDDDLSWGQGVGCDGSIHILLERISATVKNDYHKLKDLLDGRIAVSHIKVLDQNFQLLNSLFITETGEIFGTKLKDRIDFSPYENNKMIHNKQLDCYIYKQAFIPPPRLIIYGAGPDVKPLTMYAKGAGFHILLADWRSGLCNKQQFPSVDEVMIGNPIVAMEKIQPSKEDYVLIMTHNFSKDKELVNYLLTKKLRFLGLLGSKKRSQRLLLSNTIPDWLHFPIGLPINAEGPDEIAISIVAQLIAEKNKKTA
ncbi:XdhC family protein [Niallia sp. 01092]|uniref:XdhC family protein n=1 Tax=unclassified Niallia TaxID=2837522 RepID=UPI003FD38778